MPNLNKHVKQITVELTGNALSHVDEILLDNKAEETSMVPEACSKQHLPILDYSSTCTCQR